MYSSQVICQLKAENASLSDQLKQSHRLRWEAESEVQRLRSQQESAADPVAEVIEKQFLFWKTPYLVIHGDLNVGDKLYTHAQPCVKCEELKLQIGTERLRLAACGVAARSNTEKTVKHRITSEHPYWSESYFDVCRSVDREMEQREKNDRLNAQLSAVGLAPLFYLDPTNLQSLQELGDLEPGRIVEYRRSEDVSAVVFLTDGWTPTPERINALPPSLRDYIHALETNCDPAGMVSENIFAKASIDGLTAKGEKLERALASAEKSLTAAMRIIRDNLLGSPPDDGIQPYQIVDIERSLAEIRKALP